MTTETAKVATDILGIQPIAKSIEKLTDAGIAAASAFLIRICLPATEEYGLYIKDKVSYWRQEQMVVFAKRSESKMKENTVSETSHVHPRVFHEIVDKATWTDDSTTQDLWAGLLSSSCTEDGADDSNLIFINVLSQMTKLQAAVMDYACKNAQKMKMGNLIVPATDFTMTTDKFKELFGENDIDRIDRELDSLAALNLIDPRNGGIQARHQHIIVLTPSPFALHMYVRCQGSRLSPLEFFKTEIS